MFKKNKKIIFEPINILSEKKIIAEPKPAKFFVPDWYKKINPLKENKKFSREDSGITNKTVKTCIPFLDAMTGGYIVSLPCDVEATDFKENRFIWDTSYQTISLHYSFQISSKMIPENYEENPFKFNTFWTIKTPKGYSTLFTHPLNREDLPFKTISGIVDTDKYNLPINFPFFIKKGFEGIIPKGTPICQFFVFERKNWESSCLKSIANVEERENFIKSKINSSYKKHFWVPKEFK
jgi:hypothetical protein